MIYNFDPGDILSLVYVGDVTLDTHNFRVDINSLTLWR